MKQALLKTFLGLAVIFAYGISEAFAQSAFTVNGNIKDPNGEGLPGASIQIKGTQQGTISDLDGHYSISGVNSNSVLVFNFLGYTETSVTVGNQRTINVTLKEDRQLLDEVVVVGYGTMKRSDLAGSISSIDNVELTKSGKTNIINALQGQIPGLSIVRNNNKPGGGYSMNIRGISTMSGSTSPLIVVDGVAGADITTINSEDIEKVDVLKDASSASIYGSRGTNGVVMITTKRGASGKPSINYNGYVGFKSAINEPEFMGGDEWVQFAREYRRAVNNNQYVTDDKIFTDPSELKAVQDHNYFDWYDAISKTPKQTSHSLSATGGTDNVKYTIGAAYYNESGMVEPEEYTRYNFRASLDIKANKYVAFGGSIYASYYVNNMGNHDILQDAFRARPTQHPYSLVTGEEQWKFASNGIFNPMVTQKNVTVQHRAFETFGNVFLDITPIKDLSLKSVFSPYIRNRTSGRYRDTWSKALQGTQKPTAYKDDKFNLDYTWDNIANYKFNITEEHKFDLIGIFSMQKATYDDMYLEVKDLAYNSLWHNLGNGTTTSYRSKYTQTTIMSYTGRLNYNFKDRYLATLSGRYDGSSRLAEGHKWAFFPAAALAWRINQESFLRDVNWLSNLKLRLSVGKTGNDNIDPYLLLGTLSQTQYMFGNSAASGFLPGALANQSLTWEKTTEYNVGVDFGFLDGRINGSIDYYDRYADGMIMDRPLPIHIGYSSVKDNVATIRNNGMEFLLNTINIKTRDFQWTTSLNLAYNKNRIHDLKFKEDLGTYSPQLEGRQGDFAGKYIIGEPVRINWTYICEGVWQLGEEEEAKKYGAKPGQWKIKDFNKDGTISANIDQDIVGKRTPDWTGGITNTFTYRNWDLAFQMYFRTGLTARNQFFVSYIGEGTQHNFKNLSHDYWTPENPSNTYAQPGNQGAYRNNSSRIYLKADFLKVGYINLGYSLSNKLLQKTPLTKARIYAMVQNPFVFTDVVGLDPENPESTVGDDSMMTSSYLFGVNISF
jgi:TonB-linked SusC/RagA family outer membrane protein